MGIRSLRVLLVGALTGIALTGVALTGAGPVAACSGALVEAREVRAEALRIVIGTVAAIDGPREAPDRLLVRVAAVVRGQAPAELVLAPPTFMGCDGRIAESVGTRLVVATGPRFFDASPGEIHPYWRLTDGDVADPVGVDDPAGPRPLDELIAFLGGDPAPPAVDPAPPAAESDPPHDDRSVGSGPGSGWPIATLLAALGVLGGAALVAARRRAPMR